LCWTVAAFTKFEASMT